MSVGGMKIVLGFDVRYFVFRPHFCKVEPLFRVTASTLNSYRKS